MIIKYKEYIRKLSKKLKSDQGISVIEVMLAITIAGMIAGAITSFLFIHVKSFELSKNIIDLQYETQMSINQFGRVAMESMGLEYLQDATNNGALAETGDLIDPLAIAFFKSNTHITIFQYDSTEKTIYFRDEVELADATNGGPHNLDRTVNNWYVFAEDVESWTLNSGVSGDTFLDTNHINIELEFNHNDITLTLSNLFHMRNKQ